MPLLQCYSSHVWKRRYSHPTNLLSLFVTRIRQANHQTVWRHICEGCVLESSVSAVPSPPDVVRGRVNVRRHLFPFLLRSMSLLYKKKKKKGKENTEKKKNINSRMKCMSSQMMANFRHKGRRDLLQLHGATCCLQGCF